MGWNGGSFHDYDREYCVDLVQFAAFLHDTQPEASEALALSEDGPTRRAFLTRLQGEVAKRGTIDVLRNGIKHGPLHLDLFYGTPSEHNPRGGAALPDPALGGQRQEQLHRLAGAPTHRAERGRRTCI